MSDLLERERPQAGTGTLPERRPSRLPVPKIERPKPTRLIRWIKWMALIVAIAAAGILAVWLAGGGGDDAEVAPEHGEFTQAFVRGTAGHDHSGYVAIDPPDLDPEYELEGATEHMAGAIDVTPQGSAGPPSGLVASRVQGADALDRWVANHPQAVSEPDFLDRWVANHPQAVSEPDFLDRWLANHPVSNLTAGTSD